MSNYTINVIYHACFAFSILIFSALSLPVEKICRFSVPVAGYIHACALKTNSLTQAIACPKSPKRRKVLLYFVFGALIVDDLKAIGEQLKYTACSNQQTQNCLNLIYQKYSEIQFFSRENPIQFLSFIAIFFLQNSTRLLYMVEVPFVV